MTTPKAERSAAHNAEMVRRYLVWLRDVRGRRPITLYNYASKLESFLEHIGSTPLEDVRRSTLEDWQTRPRIGKGRGGRGAPATQHKDVSVLRGLYGFLVAEGAVKRNPAALLGAPTIRNVHPKPVPEDIWRRIWFSDALPDEGRVVLGLGFFVGLRRAEIIGLSPNHVSTPARRLVGFTRKGGGDDITPYGEMVAVIVDVLPQLVGDASSFLDPLHSLVAARLGRSYLLPWGEERTAGPWTTRAHGLPAGMADPQLIYRRLWRWQRACGVEPGVFSPHALRHSTATNLLRAGVPIHLVSRLLNHSDIKMTMRYAKAGSDELGEWRRQRGSLGDEFGRFG